MMIFFNSSVKMATTSLNSKKLITKNKYRYIGKSNHNAKIIAQFYGSISLLVFFFSINSVEAFCDHFAPPPMSSIETFQVEINVQDFFNGDKIPLKIGQVNVDELEGEDSSLAVKWTHSKEVSYNESATFTDFNFLRWEYVKEDNIFIVGEYRKKNIHFFTVTDWEKLFVKEVANFSFILPDSSNLCLGLLPRKIGNDFLIFQTCLDSLRIFDANDLLNVTLKTNISLVNGMNSYFKNEEESELLYIVCGTAYAVYNVSDIYNISLVGRFDETAIPNYPPPTKTISRGSLTFFENDIAFLAGTFDILVLNFSDPKNITFISHLNHNDEYKYVYKLQISRAEKIMYAILDAQFYIFNISDPKNIVSLGSSAPITNLRYNFATINNTSFVGTATGYVVLSHKNPSKVDIVEEYIGPSIENRFPMFKDDVMIFGNRYSALVLYRMKAYLVANPPLGITKSRILTHFNISLENAAGQQTTCQSRIILSTLAPIQSISEESISVGEAFGIFFAKNEKYKSLPNDIVTTTIHYVDEDVFPQFVNQELLLDLKTAKSHQEGFLKDVVIDNDIAFAVGDAGIFAYDISDVNNIVLMGSNSYRYGVKLTVYGDYLLLGCGWGGFRVFDKSNLTSITEIWSTAGECYDSDIVNDILYFACGQTEGLKIYNFSNPWNLQLLNQYDTDGYAYDVKVRGELAYVANYGGGLAIYNISDPSNIVWISVFGTKNSYGMCISLDLNGNLVYAIIQHYGMLIFNVEDPHNIVLVSQFRSLAGDPWPQRVKVIGNVAFLAYDSGGLLVVDVSDPQNPFTFGYHIPDFKVWGIDVTPNKLVALGFIYVINNGFLNVYDVTKHAFRADPKYYDIGNYKFNIKACVEFGEQKEKHCINDFFTLRVEGEPEVTGVIKKKNAKIGKPFNVFISQDVFYDANEDSFKFEAKLENGNSLPEWLSFNAVAGIFSGTPEESDKGSLTITVTAHDQRTGSASTSFDLLVDNTPVLVNPIPNMAINIGSYFQYTIPSESFMDADGDVLLYSASLDNGEPLPSWLTFNSSTRMFKGTPSSENFGSPKIRVTVLDGNQGFASSSFVLNIHNFPLLGGFLDAQVANIGDYFVFTLPSNLFVDVDGDIVQHYSQLSNNKSLPKWLDFDPATRTYSGIPLESDYGNISITVFGVDTKQGSNSTNFNIEVQHFPVVQNSVPKLSANIDSDFLYCLVENTFIDIDEGDSIVLSAFKDSTGGPLPDWVHFNSTCFSGNPNISDQGLINGIICAKDMHGGKAETPFTLEIQHFPEVVGEIGLLLGNIDSPFVYVFSENLFSDKDSDILIYEASKTNGDPLPTWLEFKATLRTFTGTPRASDFGGTDLKLTADDKRGGIISVDFQLFVEHFPVVAKNIPKMTANVDSDFAFCMEPNTFTDADYGDYLLLSLQSHVRGEQLPSWLQFNSTCFYGHPTESDQGIVSGLVLARDTYGGQVEGLFNVEVEHFPVVTPGGIDLQQLVNIDFAFVYQFDENLFSDSDNDILLYRASMVGGEPLPSWLEFKSAIRTFSGTPRATDYGNVVIRLSADDRRGGLSSVDFSLIVEHFPVVQKTIPRLTVNVDSDFGYCLEANTFYDADIGDSLQFSIQSQIRGEFLPNWLQFNSSSCFYGHPISSDQGIVNGLLRAIDSLGAIAEVAFTIEVEHFPEVTPGGVPLQLADIDHSYVFQFAENLFSDQDSDILIYKASLMNEALPSWLEFKSLIRIFTGTPRATDYGFLNIMVTADDRRGGKTSTTFILIVEHFPVVQKSIPKLTVNIDSDFVYCLEENTFIDVDEGDVLTLSATVSDNTNELLPEWLDFNSSCFSGHPTESDQGILQGLIRAVDTKGGSRNTKFVIEVEYFPQVLPGGIPSQHALIDEYFAFQFEAGVFIDKDDKFLSFTASRSDGSSLPSWIEFKSDLRIFSGTPSFGDKGKLSVKIVAKDQRGGQNETEFDIHVNNRPVSNYQIENMIVEMNNNYSHQFPNDLFTDPDNDTLSYRLELRPEGREWLSLNSSSSLTLKLSGTPSELDIGITKVKIIVNDHLSGIAFSTFEILVNAPPRLSQMLSTQSAFVQKMFTFQIPFNTFVDEDGGIKGYEAVQADGSELPNWLEFDGTIGRFTGIPSNTDKGQLKILVTARDGHGSYATGTFDIFVPNQEPIKNTEIVGQEARTWRYFEFAISGTMFQDPDQDDLQFTARLKGGNPLSKSGWLHFNEKTRVFYGTPSLWYMNEWRDIEVELLITDNFSTLTGSFEIRVNLEDAFKDILRYYAMIGAFVVLVSLILRIRRVQKFKYLIEKIRMDAKKVKIIEKHNHKSIERGRNFDDEGEKRDTGDEEQKSERSIKRNKKGRKRLINRHGLDADDEKNKEEKGKSDLGRMDRKYLHISKVKSMFWEVWQDVILQEYSTIEKKMRKFLSEVGRFSEMNDISIFDVASVWKLIEELILVIELNIKKLDRGKRNMLQRMQDGSERFLTHWEHQMLVENKIDVIPFMASLSELLDCILLLEVKENRGVVSEQREGLMYRIRKLRGNLYKKINNYERKYFLLTKMLYSVSCMMGTDSVMKTSSWSKWFQEFVLMGVNPIYGFYKLYLEFLDIPDLWYLDLIFLKNLMLSCAKDSQSCTEKLQNKIHLIIKGDCSSIDICCLKYDVSHRWVLLYGIVEILIDLGKNTELSSVLKSVISNENKPDHADLEMLLQYSLKYGKYLYPLSNNWVKDRIMSGTFTLEKRARKDFKSTFMNQKTLMDLSVVLKQNLEDCNKELAIIDKSDSKLVRREGETGINEEDDVIIINSDNVNNSRVRISSSVEETGAEEIELISTNSNELELGPIK